MRVFFSLVLLASLASALPTRSTSGETGDDLKVSERLFLGLVLDDGQDNHSPYGGQANNNVSIKKI